MFFFFFTVSLDLPGAAVQKKLFFLNNSSIFILNKIPVSWLNLTKIKSVGPWMCLALHGMEIGDSQPQYISVEGQIDMMYANKQSYKLGWD